VDVHVDFVAFVVDFWPHLSTALVIALSVLTSGHAILNKREVHASIAWAGLIWLAPVFGALAYLLLGRNRIRRRAARLRTEAPSAEQRLELSSIAPQALASHLGRDHESLAELAALMRTATGAPLCEGNRVRPLADGDVAYPAMLQAIESARRTVALTTYIFEATGPGARFVDALADAVQRGVSVRVLVDDVGARYSRTSITHALRARGVRVARFMPARRATYFNLRNHRKLLVVDGERAFTGGMNIRPHHVLRDAPEHPTHDLHFEVCGPVVTQLAHVFVEDWCFTTREVLQQDLWLPRVPSAGNVPARAIPDGPDEDIDKVRWALLGAIACARRSIRIMTPYFLPDTTLATALNVAALRGVRVDILVPERGNLPPVQWAMWGHFRKVIGHGCRLWLNRGTFDHSKVMIVDDHWTLLGSANWDPRSLRLNFELCVECYSSGLAAELARHFDARVESAERVTSELLERRPLSVQLRDGVARLFTPYL
jgi:cardiolipin synthase